MTMLAFHNDPKVKKKYRRRVRAHRAADQIVHGQYWADGKGCAVGCTIHGSDHGRYEKELGIPAAIAQLEDAIFEGISNGDSQTWPERFLDAIPVGADLSLIWSRFALWLLADPTDGVIRFVDDEQGKAANRGVAALHQRIIDGGEVKDEEWDAALDAAWDAAWDANLNKAYVRQSEKLLELLAAAPVPEMEPA